MTLEMIKRVLSMGDNKGSALRQMLKDLKDFSQKSHWL